MEELVSPYKPPQPSTPHPIPSPFTLHPKTYPESRAVGGSSRGRTHGPLRVNASAATHVVEAKKGHPPVPSHCQCNTPRGGGVFCAEEPPGAPKELVVKPCLTPGAFTRPQASHDPKLHTTPCLTPGAFTRPQACGRASGQALFDPRGLHSPFEPRSRDDEGTRRTQCPGHDRLVRDGLGTRRRRSWLGH